MSKTSHVLNRLRDVESRNVTFIDPEGGWPIVWERAKGVYVWDVEGRKYLDLTGAFGVANAGHANSAVVRAGQQQMARLLHAMGDVHPHALKANLAAELSRITFGRWKRGAGGKTIFCNAGFEAVEAALKTARLATGRKGIIAFEDGYHGLGYGALNATHRSHFRARFENQIGGFGHFVPYPKQGLKRSPRVHLKSCEQLLMEAFESGDIGAVLVEPAQARGGIHIPPAGFLKLLRRVCDAHGALLILDEIYTGFGRTGKWFACEHERVVPDLICVGKALTGGFPMSACIGRAGVMDAAWPVSNGEAIHTSTFLGHPVGCAMALAQIKELRRLDLIERSARLGKELLSMLQSMRSRLPHLNMQSRGIGLMAGIELFKPDGSPDTQTSLRAIKEMLHRGFIMLPEGEHANVISFTPPLTISVAQLCKAVTALGKVLAEFRKQD